MVAVTVSASLEESDAQKVRVLAAREHRSISGFVSNAIMVFADLPRDLRDALLELRAESSPSAFQAMAREMAATVARRRFDMATERLVAQRKFPAVSEDASEQDLLDEASAIVRGP